jgi:tRNA/rRNA methyltransferase
MGLEHCRIVLVRPRVASNIGATARAMRNFGVEDLFLVAPCAEPSDPRARLLAKHAEDVLERARTVARLEDALADCLLAAATSSRSGGLFRKQSLGTPDTIFPQLLPVLEQGPVALVFGPERNGLRTRELARCHYLIRIPSDARAPALNLAQAVTVCLYELHRQELQARPTSAPASRPATWQVQERAFRHLQLALEEIHFLYGAKAEALMYGLRHLLGRANPTDMEVKLLHGLARQICWFVRNRGVAQSEREAGHTDEEGQATAG